MTLDLASLVTLFCQRHSLLEADKTIVVAVSGGVDSLCMLHVLLNISSQLNLKLVVAHLNHLLRGTDSEADAQFVEQVAHHWRLPFFWENHDIRQIAATRRQSIEQTARQVRYAFLWRTAAKVGAQAIAVGHNADDQVETVLMHFLRGSGLPGLGGMLPKTNIASIGLNPIDIAGLSVEGAPVIIRPLLDQSRATIEAYANSHELAPRQDKSNQGTIFFRNRLRHELIPKLETYNPNIRQAVLRLAKVVAADNRLLAEQVNIAWDQVVTKQASDYVALNRTTWLQLPLSLKRATLRRAIEIIAHGLQDIDFEHIEQSLTFVEQGGSGQQINLPHKLVITIGYGTFSIANPAALLAGHTADRPHLVSQQTVTVNVPGRTLLPNEKWQLTTTFVDSHTVGQPVRQAGNWEAYLDADTISGELFLRSRTAGDAFSPLGMAGHSQKVKDFMINQKIPAHERDAVPLLVAGNDILWVCGYRLNDIHRVRPETNRILHLKFEPT